MTFSVSSCISKKSHPLSLQKATRRRLHCLVFERDTESFRLIEDGAVQKYNLREVSHVSRYIIITVCKHHCLRANVK